MHAIPSDLGYGSAIRFVSYFLTLLFLHEIVCSGATQTIYGLERLDRTVRKRADTVCVGKKEPLLSKNVASEMVTGPVCERGPRGKGRRSEESCIQFPCV